MDGMQTRMCALYIYIYVYIYMCVCVCVGSTRVSKGLTNLQIVQFFDFRAGGASSPSSLALDECW